MFTDKILLITGGTGSFGNAVLKRFLNSEVKEIRIFSRDKKKQEEMCNRLQSRKVKFYIGDVTDKKSVDRAMKDVDFVFHAAALKQVPQCESMPVEAVLINVLGTENVLNSAIEQGVKKVVVLSTDKACYPVSAMGISKAMMEKVVMAKARSLGKCSSTVFCCTRYGNVLGSNGSVVPLWVEQIKAKRDITITDPSMSRFMMTLDEAVDLVLFAFQHGENGDLFVQKAPAATLDVLAQSLIELYRSSSKICVTGARLGEKNYETLITREEMVRAQDMGNFFCIPCDAKESGNVTDAKEKKLDDDYHSLNSGLLDKEEMMQKLLKLQMIRDDIGKK
ncbi:MAG: SDR family NAD(P)-dependent oxidoreductase [Bacteroidales bacterium]|nr:SDR family NAD(P)-dependent oxidoreductase [Bacteroidales bacterium]MDD4713754.1 SDR family NAD(P)-dependent oxidoreductase [Bacteroidales bacterium]